MPALADQSRLLDYLVPPNLVGVVDIGSAVRVPLHGRRVTGWVVALDVDPPVGVVLQRITTWTGRGPSADLVELSRWAAWRWVGRRTAMLRAATPVRAVRSLPPPGSSGGTGRPSEPEPARLAREALAAGEAVIRLPPAADQAGLVCALLADRPGLIVAPSIEAAAEVGRRLRGSGTDVAVVPDGWARAAAGGRAVIGARAAAWAPAPDARVIVVVDAHDNALVEERAPSWSSWVVAAERARRMGVPCVLISPCPTLEQLRWGSLVLPDRASERRGWAAIEVDDRRHADPRTGLIGERLVGLLRTATVDCPVLCVLNRKGRVRLLRCRTCGALTVCEHCEGAMVLERDADGADRLACSRCGRSRATVCQACGGAALRAVRTGVTRVREELEAVARVPVGEVTAEVDLTPPVPILVGTEALLRRIGPGRASAVVFLDFDSELLAPRFRAREEALVLLARAGRAVGGRGDGLVLVQTRQPSHVVIEAAVRADPGRLVDVELAQREDLALPPLTALASLSGDETIVSEVAAALRGETGVEVLGPSEGHWVVRAPDHATLCDALERVGRPVGAGNQKLRIDVDPLRL